MLRECGLGCSSQKTRATVKVTGTGVYMDACGPKKRCSCCFLP